MSFSQQHHNSCRPKPKALTPATSINAGRAYLVSDTTCRQDTTEDSTKISPTLGQLLRVWNTLLLWIVVVAQYLYYSKLWWFILSVSFTPSLSILDSKLCCTRRVSLAFEPQNKAKKPPEHKLGLSKHLNFPAASSASYNKLKVLQKAKKTFNFKGLADQFVRKVKIPSHLMKQLIYCQKNTDQKNHSKLKQPKSLHFPKGEESLTLVWRKALKS